MNSEELTKVLINKIDNGSYKYAQSIPSERQLAETYKIKRASVKKAIQNLVQMEYLLSVHGKGTFVKKNIHENLQIKFYGFSELVEREGLKPSTMILASAVKKAGYIVSRALKIQHTDLVFHIVRLRSGDDEPISIEDTYIPLSLIPDLQLFDFQIFSFYSVLAANNYQIDNIYQTVSSSKVRKNEARLLKTAINQPVITMKIQAVTNKEQVVEYTEVAVLPEFAAIYTKNVSCGKETKIYAQID